MTYTFKDIYFYEGANDNEPLENAPFDALLSKIAKPTEHMRWLGSDRVTKLLEKWKKEDER